MDTAKIADKLVNWIKNKVQGAGGRGVILGLSGGIDSAVVAGLASRAFPDSTLGVIMPCHSLAMDAEHAKLAAEHFKIPYRTVDLAPIYDSFLDVLRDDKESHKLAAANIKPRLRMTTLYYLAQERGYLVLGTGNRTELTIGYFTKYGDGGVDLLPIGGLVKDQVRELARYLNVPEVIILKPPSAGLWEGQTDEGEMGLTYKDLDNYILTGEASLEVRDDIDRLHRISEHKRNTAPIPELD